jgi:predicted dehydrogenase
MVDCARDTGQLLMEGMWTRFFPVVEQVRTWVEDGAIGAPQLMQFSMSTRQARDPESRLFDPALGGGTLLDLGVYPVSFASMLCGRPDAVAAQATIGPTEVDEQATALLQYDDGPHVTFALSMRTEMPVRGVVAGTEGRIEIDRPWFNPTRATLHRFGDDEPVPVEEPHENGFEYEAAAVTCLVSEGASESAVMPLGESVSVMETLDRLRAAIGLEYPDRTAA